MPDDIGWNATKIHCAPCRRKELRIEELDGQIKALCDAREQVAMMIPVGIDTGTVEQNLARYIAGLKRDFDTVNADRHTQVEALVLAEEALTEARAERDGARAEVERLRRQRGDALEAEEMHGRNWDRACALLRMLLDGRCPECGRSMRVDKLGDDFRAAYCETSAGGCGYYITRDMVRAEAGDRESADSASHNASDQDDHTDHG